MPIKKIKKTLSLFHGYSFAKANTVAKGGISVLNRVVPCKTRYILTSNNRLRLRYIASGVAGVALVCAFTPGGANPALQSKKLPGEIANLEPAAGLETMLGNFRDDSGQIRRHNLVTPPVMQTAALTIHEAPLAPKDVSLKVGKGDTFSEVLQEAGVTADEAKNVVDEVAQHFNMRKLRAGQKMDLRLEPDEDRRSLAFSKVSFVIDPLKTIHVERKGENLKSYLDEKPVKETRRAAKVVIDGSMYTSADKAGLPDRITANAIKLFSYTVDFQRDLKQGDRLEVLYDSTETTDGYVAKTGDIIYARMVLNGRELAVYRFDDGKGNQDYYTADGKSIKKAGGGLMKTPVAYGRISSGFGMRQHPIMGFTKMHKGTDFAAPTGTPVFAAADGTVERASRFSGYGNYVKIRHSGKMETAYAHLSRYAAGIRPGTRVKQGQVIAYVGTTGNSTGPHLHFEVLANGVQVNPGSVKTMTDNSLQGEQLRKFKAQIRNLDQEYVRKSSNVKLASLRGPNLNSVE